LRERVNSGLSGEGGEVAVLEDFDGDGLGGGEDVFNFVGGGELNDEGLRVVRGVEEDVVGEVGGEEIGQRNLPIGPQRLLVILVWEARKSDGVRCSGVVDANGFRASFVLLCG
jgi:hypothetical protein